MPRMAEHPQASVPSCGRARAPAGGCCQAAERLVALLAQAPTVHRAVCAVLLAAQSLGLPTTAPLRLYLFLLLAGRSLRCPHCLPLSARDSARDCCLRVIEAALCIVEPCDN